MDLERLTPKVESAVERLCDALGSWDEVEAVALLLSGDDLYDPYFSLSLDVYTTDPIRAPAERQRAFGDVTVFESSPLTHKDRFLVGEIPFRAEYKQTARFDQLVAEAHHGRSILREGGTYAFHRVITAKQLYSVSDWYENIRLKMERLPESFWEDLRSDQEANAEHTYADLSAAAVRGDELYFSISAGRFLTAVCSLLFAVNQKFEPSHRALYDEVMVLPTLPDSFPANLENFVAETPLSMGQRRELAELMVTSVMALYGSR